MCVGVSLCVSVLGITFSRSAVYVSLVQRDITHRGHILVLMDIIRLGVWGQGGSSWRRLVLGRRLKRLQLLWRWLLRDSLFFFWWRWWWACLLDNGYRLNSKKYNIN